MLVTYLEQLQNKAEDTGWNLKEACVDAGIAETTFYRWNKKITNPRQDQAQQVAEYMKQYAR